MMDLGLISDLTVHPCLAIRAALPLRNSRTLLLPKPLKASRLCLAACQRKANEKSFWKFRVRLTSQSQFGKPSINALDRQQSAVLPRMRGRPQRYAQGSI